MFEFLKKKDETPVAEIETSSVAVAIRPKKKPKTTDLNVIAEYYVDNTMEPKDDVESIDEQIKKNDDAVGFLQSEITESAFENEIPVFRDEVTRLSAENEKLECRKEQQKFEGLYPKIDLSFLSMRKENTDNQSRFTTFSSSSYGNSDRQIDRIPHAPAFSIHRLRQRGTSFSFEGCKIAIKYVKNVHDQSAICWLSMSAAFHVLQNIGKVFTKLPIEKNDYTGRSDAAWRETIPTIDNEEWFRGDDVTLSSEFRGLLPSATKKRIIDSIDKFKRPNSEACDIYLIKECEDWTTTVVTRDPLIVGIVGDQAYLIDHFDCTDMESYVKTEFTS
ncbi:MAG: hypothetical protein ACTSRU_17705 [Candidatus Hodarchaeales archaeon]